MFILRPDDLRTMHNVWNFNTSAQRQHKGCAVSEGFFFQKFRNVSSLQSSISWIIQWTKYFKYKLGGVVLNRCPSAQCQSWYYFIFYILTQSFLRISLIHRFKCTTLIPVHLYKVQKMFLLCVTSRIFRYEVLPFTDNSNHAFCVAFAIIWCTDLFIYQRKKKKSKWTDVTQPASRDNSDWLFHGVWRGSGNQVEKTSMKQNKEQKRKKISILCALFSINTQ